MRYSRGTHKHLWFTKRPLIVALGFGISACAHFASQKTEAPMNSQDIQKSLPGALDSLSSLEKQEYQEPSNATVKWQLGLRYWCEHKRGLAIESWLWIEQFVPKSPLAESARRMIHFAKEEPEEVEKHIPCR